MSTFGSLLEQVIKERKMTRADVCKATGISTSYLSAIIRGSKVPPQKTVQDVIRRLNLDSKTSDQLLRAVQDTKGRQPDRKIMHIGGIIKVHNSLPEDVFNTWIAGATERIWILDTWVESPIRYKDPLLTAVKNNASHRNLSVRILFLHPDCESAKQRSKDLWLRNKIDDSISKEIEMYVPNSIQNSIDKFKLVRASILTDLEDHAISIDNNFMDIKTHGHLPSFSVYLCDNKALMGFYIHGRFSNDVPQLEVHLDPNHTEDSRVFRMMEAEFQKLWEVAKSTD